MDYSTRWEIIGELGEGGQGKVSRVVDRSRFNSEKALGQIRASLLSLASVTEQVTLNRHFESFRNTVVELVRREDPSHHGALKVLHEPQDARDADRTEERIKREIKAMQETSHPNLLKILDADPDGKWFVSQYHPKGTLAKNLEQFKGDFPKALQAFRQLVTGVAELHKKNVVHRDIKPQNVFIDAEDHLVLGDFGLVFFTDDQRTRISDTLENVGSWQWMPGWAFQMRVNDLRPTLRRKRTAFQMRGRFWKKLTKFCL